VTIADYAADVRAPTPTAAGALAVPDRRELERALGETAVRLRRLLVRRVTAAREGLERYARAVGAQRRRLQEHAVRADELGRRARRAGQARVAWERRGSVAPPNSSAAAHPAARLAQAGEQVRGFATQLRRAMRRCGRRARASARRLRLDVLSPLASLARGYAICRREDRTGGCGTQRPSPGRRHRRIALARGRARAASSIRRRRESSKQEEPRFGNTFAELGAVTGSRKAGSCRSKSLVAFERGMVLVRALSERLAAIEQRVEVLVRGAEGTLERRPLTADDH
jgi:exodeoxyribonuclease VII large subunit